MARLCALAQLDFDHLDLGIGGTLDKFLVGKGAVEIAAAEISRADFPDEVAAAFLVIGADRSFAGVMSKVAELRTTVE